MFSQKPIRSNLSGNIQKDIIIQHEKNNSDFTKKMPTKEGYRKWEREETTKMKIVFKPENESSSLTKNKQKTYLFLMSMKILKFWHRAHPCRLLAKREKKIFSRHLPSFSSIFMASCFKVLHKMLLKINVFWKPQVWWLMKVSQEIFCNSSLTGILKSQMIGKQHDSSSAHAEVYIQLSPTEFCRSTYSKAPKICKCHSGERVKKHKHTKNQLSHDKSHA